MNLFNQLKKNAWGTVHHLFVVHPYCGLRQLMPVWQYVSNQESRRMFNQHPPQLDEVQKHVVRDFQRDGVAVSHLDELFPDRYLLSRLQQYTRERIALAEVKSGKQFLRYLWDAVPQFDFDNPFLKIALDSRVLDIINSYLGMWGKFYFFTLNITDPVAPGAKPVQSQRWHRDSEDKRIPKIFIYLNDVDEDAGPFICVKESHYGGKWRSLFGQRPPHGSRAPFGRVEQIVPEQDIKLCTGRAGTVVFFDTSGLHKGGYATKKERIMFTGVYASGASYKYNNHRGFRYPEHFSDKLASASLCDEARYAITPTQPSSPMRMVNRLGKPRIEKEY